MVWQYGKVLLPPILGEFSNIRRYLSGVSLDCNYMKAAKRLSNNSKSLYKCVPLHSTCDPSSSHFRTTKKHLIYIGSTPALLQTSNYHHLWKKVLLQRSLELQLAYRLLETTTNTSRKHWLDSCRRDPSTQNRNSTTSDLVSFN